MSVEIVALDHLYVSVRDLAVSEAFYDPVMRALGFRKGTTPIEGEPHVHYFSPVMAYTIRPARSDTPHDPYCPGLHHLCLRVAERADVDRASAALAGLGVETTPPRLYPQYAPDYYATFFRDPDGLRLEIVAETRVRRIIREHWSELVEWQDPLQRSGLL